MIVFVWIILGIVVLVGLGLALSYNRFVSQRQLIRNAFANIDTELRRRYDLIPNIVETVKGYAAHEREVFEEVARTRSAAAATTGQSPAAQAAAEGPFVQALGRLFAVAENYPELKANQNFLALQSELSNTEDRIQAARRFYNANVQDYNRRVNSHRPDVPLQGRGVLRDPRGPTSRRGRSPTRRLRVQGRCGPRCTTTPCWRTSRRISPAATTSACLTRGRLASWSLMISRKTASRMMSMDFPRALGSESGRKPVSVNS